MNIFPRCARKFVTNFIRKIMKIDGIFQKISTLRALICYGARIENDRGDVEEMMHFEREKENSETNILRIPTINFLSFGIEGLN